MPSRRQSTPAPILARCWRRPSSVRCGCLATTMAAAAKGCTHDRVKMRLLRHLLHTVCARSEAFRVLGVVLTMLLDDRELNVQASVRCLWCRQVRLHAGQVVINVAHALATCQQCAYTLDAELAVLANSTVISTSALTSQCRDGGHALRRNADHAMRSCGHITGIGIIPRAKQNQNAEDHFLQ
jgi:hypothetical protein